MRLIDADEVINIFKETGIIQDNDLGQCVIAEINRIPTAYDVDKVVEQLKNEKEFWSDATYNKEIGKQKARSYEHAIEIVKGGVMND